MEIKTRDFGSVTLERESTIQFVEPIFGFEEYTEFILLSDSDIGDNILWLQSTQEQDLCFMLIEPRLAYPEYSPNLTDDTKLHLSENGIKNHVFWTIAVVPEEFSKSTINLKSPLVIDPETRNAAQIILDEDYPIRAPLMPQGKGGA